jgi:chromosome segregation ATPase
MVAKKKEKKRRSDKAGERLRKRQRDKDAGQGRKAPPADYMPAYANSNLVSGGGSVGFAQNNTGATRVQPYNSGPYQAQIENALLSVSRLATDLQDTKQMAEQIGKQKSDIDHMTKIAEKDREVDRAVFDKEKTEMELDRRVKFAEFTTGIKLRDRYKDKEFEYLKKNIELEMALEKDTKINNLTAAKNLLESDANRMMKQLDEKNKEVSQLNDQLKSKDLDLTDLQNRFEFEYGKMETELTTEITRLETLQDSKDDQINKLIESNQKASEEYIQLSEMLDDSAKRLGDTERQYKQEINQAREDILEYQNNLKDATDELEQVKLSMGINAEKYKEELIKLKNTTLKLDEEKKQLRADLTRVVDENKAFRDAKAGFRMEGTKRVSLGSGSEGPKPVRLKPEVEEGQRVVNVGEAMAEDSKITGMDEVTGEAMERE